MKPTHINRFIDSSSFVYFLIYKPYQVLSQFSSVDGKATLKNFFDVPGDVYPVGRLDFDSEGLLLLTNDPKLNHPLLHPSFAHEREYWVEVEGIITDLALQQLQAGVEINNDGKPYRSKPCKAQRLAPVTTIPERKPPVRFRKNIPTQWISIILTEGKNRQVRKMTAAVGFPTLRLIRYRIAALTIESLQPGEMISTQKRIIYKKLGFDAPV